MTQEQETTGYPNLAPEEAPYCETYECARVGCESFDAPDPANRPVTDSIFYLDDYYYDGP